MHGKGDHAFGSRPNELANQNPVWNLDAIRFWLRYNWANWNFRAVLESNSLPV